MSHFRLCGEAFRIHVGTDFLAVDVVECLVLEPADGLGGRASALGFAALGMFRRTLRLAECLAAEVIILTSFTGERFWLFC